MLSEDYTEAVPRVQSVAAGQDRIVACNMRFATNPMGRIRVNPSNPSNQWSILWEDPAC